MSMGTAWMNQGVYPWKVDTYVGGIENAKVAMAFRIFQQKWHVYAGLGNAWSAHTVLANDQLRAFTEPAIMNPQAHVQVLQYARSTAELFQLVVTEQDEAFRKRVGDAAAFVFGKGTRKPALLSDDWLDEFSLSSIPKQLRKPNSHLSLLAIVDCWHCLGMYVGVVVVFRSCCMSDLLHLTYLPYFSYS